MIHYRTATPKDWEAIALLHAQSWQLSYRGILSDRYLDHEIIEERKKVWKKRFLHPAENQFAIMAFDADQFCGFSCVYADHDAKWGALLDNLHVLPQWRGKRIGAELLIRGAAWSHQQDPESYYYLWVFEENVGARAFYERLGGENVETIVGENPDGTKSRIIRFVWRNVGKLVSG